MAASEVYTLGDMLVKRFATRNPFLIAEQLGNHILFCKDFGPLKGMYRVIKRNRFIFINRDLDEPTQALVCAHEIGHDQLHRKLGTTGGLQEFSFYDLTARPEYEANIVAADILLDTGELLDYIYTYQFNVEEIANAMCTNTNLVALKIESLNHKGYSIRPQDYRSDFLR